MAFCEQAHGHWGYFHRAGSDRDSKLRPLAPSIISPSHPGTTISTRGDGTLPERSRFAPAPSHPDTTISTRGNGTLPERSMFAPINRKRSIPTDLWILSDSSDSSNASASELGEKSVWMGGLPHQVADAESGKYLQKINDSSSDRANHYTSYTNALNQRSAPLKRRKVDASNHELDHLSHVSPLARLPSDAPAPVRIKLTRNEREIQLRTARIENHLELKLFQIFTPWADADQKLGRTTLQTIWKTITLMHHDTPQDIAQTLNKALNGGDGKRRPAGGRTPTSKYFQKLVASLQSTGTADSNGGGPNTSSPPMESNHQQLDRSTFQSVKAVSAKATEPDPPSILPDGNHHQPVRESDLDTRAPPALPHQKHTRTTLFIRLAPSPQYLPLKLSECTTSRAFHTQVLGAWTVREESVATITVTFSWMNPEDTTRTMAMNRGMEGCFAHLVERVEEAPC